MITTDHTSCPDCAASWDERCIVHAEHARRLGIVAAVVEQIATAPDRPISYHVWCLVISGAAADESEAYRAVRAAEQRGLLAR